MGNFMEKETKEEDRGNLAACPDLIFPCLHPTHLTLLSWIGTNNMINCKLGEAMPVAQAVILSQQNHFQRNKRED